MNQTINDIISKDKLWKRLLYVIAFLFINSLLKGVIAITAIVQFVHVLFKDSPNPIIAEFSQGLANYSYHISRFVTFLSDEKPFPLSPWDNKAPDH